MRIFSYRNKLLLRRILVILAVVAAVILVFCVVRFIYLQRYLVFSSGTVYFDYDQELTYENLEQPQLDVSDFPIEMVDPEESVSVGGSDQELKTLSGYYITTAMMQDMTAVNQALEEVESLSALLLDMKSIYGNFYFASPLAGANTASADLSAIATLIETLDREGRTYLIARVPAFSDSNFALANQSCGLPLSSGALWMDSNGCYWLNPADSDVQDYLVSIAQALSELGFDEVVFDGFYFPDSQNIVFEGDKQAAVAAAAQAIREKLEGTPIRVSFGSSDTNVAASADRVYLASESGAEVAGIVEQLSSSLENPATQVVFCTASRDTRYEGYGILRPLLESDSES